MEVQVHTETFAYCFGVHLAETILTHTDNLNKTLQSTQMTAVDAQVVARATVKTLESIRSEAHFKLFWAKLIKFISDHNRDEPKLQRMSKPTPKCNIGNTAGDRDHRNKAEDDCRQKCYAVLDTVISRIKDRFMQDDYEMFSTLEQLVLKAANGQPCEEEFEKIVFFSKTNFDCDILKVQILTVPSNIGSVLDDTFETFHDLRKAVMKLNT